jgi:hypothetical protein
MGVPAFFAISPCAPMEPMSPRNILTYQVQCPTDPAPQLKARPGVSLSLPTRAKENRNEVRRTAGACMPFTRCVFGPFDHGSRAGSRRRSGTDDDVDDDNAYRPYGIGTLSHVGDKLAPTGLDICS